jgi:hypothetical protein
VHYSIPFECTYIQNPGSSLKYKSFLLEVADYWAGISLEETHEEGDIEAADEDADPNPPTPHAPRSSVGRLSADMKERQPGICWRWKK